MPETAEIALNHWMAWPATRAGAIGRADPRA